MTQKKLHPLPIGAKLEKRVKTKPTQGKDKGKLVDTGWLIYQVDGVRVYRFDSPGLGQVVDYYMDTQGGVHRVQIKGSHMAFDQVEVFPANGLKGAAFTAMFNALEDGLYRPSGFWEKQVAFFRGKEPDTEAHGKLTKAQRQYAPYITYTYGK